MKYSKIGKTDIEVSKIGLGTNYIGGHNLYSNIDEDLGKQIVKKALDLGVTFFDTADSYGFGRSEELIGEVLKKHRSDVIISSKGGREKLNDGTIRLNIKPDYLRKAFEASLKRLQTDYIDIYYIHFPDGKTPLIEAVGELTRLKEEGKIRSIGIANVTFQELSEANAHNHIDLIQCGYNMLSRGPEKELLPYCVHKDISFIPYGPLAHGILGGRYDRNFQLEEQDWRKGVEGAPNLESIRPFKREVFLSNLDIIDKLKYFASQKGVSLPNLALAWLMHQDGIDAVIPGAKKIEQVKENIVADQIQLFNSDLREIRAILEQ